jgi:hypothetical protein
MKFFSQLPELYVIVHVCSLRVLTYNCTLYTWLPQCCLAWEKNFSVLPCQSGDVLVLEFNLQLSSPPVKMYSPSTFIPSKPFEFIHVGALSYSCIDIHVMINSISQSWTWSFWSCSQPFELKQMSLLSMHHIAQACGSIRWTNMHTHERFQYSYSISLMFWWGVMP